MKCLIAVLIIAATPVLAQDLSWSPMETETCLERADSMTSREACVGRSATACIEQPGAYTTVGMVWCFMRAGDYWDERLNRAYTRLMALEETADAEIRSYGGRAPAMAPALRDMQRAWIAFRDAACEYEVTQWGGGTGGGPAHADCRMRMTARQALVLENRLAQKEIQ